MAPLRGQNKLATKNCGCMRIDSIIHSYSHLKSLAELLVIFSGSRETLELLTSRDTEQFFANPPNEDEHACEAGLAESQ